MTETTQEYSLASEEIECNLIEDENDKYDNTIITIPTQVILRTKLNLKWKCKRKQKWQKEKYSRKVKVKMKKKIASMIMNATKEYSMGEEDTGRGNETKGILKTIDHRQLTKKKRVPNQLPDHLT